MTRRRARKITVKEPIFGIACSICERRQEGGKEAFAIKGKLVCISCAHVLVDAVVLERKGSE